MAELLTAKPEAPMGEIWQWQTDILTSDNGTEQRIANSQLPRRSISGKHVFLDDALIRRFVMAMTVAKGNALEAPFFQYETALTATAAAAASDIFYAARDTQLVSGDLAMLYDDDETVFERVSLNVATETGSSLNTPLVNTWPIGSLIAPVHLVFMGSGLNFNRLGVDGAGDVSLNMKETGFHSPFVNAFNATVLPTYLSEPLLTIVPIGREFNEQFITGSTITNYGGPVDIRSKWKRVKEQFSRVFRVARIVDRAAWEFWFKFAEAIVGNQKPFWIPSYRHDFEIVTPPAPSGTTMTMSGHFFRDYCFPHAGLKHIFIESDGGLHLALVSGVADSSGNDLITFTPALPAGSPYSLNQKIGILYRCRLTDDRFSWLHFAANSSVTLNMITTDE